MNHRRVGQKSWVWAHWTDFFFFFFCTEKGQERRRKRECLPAAISRLVLELVDVWSVLYTYTRGRLSGHVFDVVSSKLFASLFVSGSFEEKTFGRSRVSDIAKKVRSVLLPDGSFLLLCALTDIDAVTMTEQLPTARLVSQVLVVAAAQTARGTSQ